MAVLVFVQLTVVAAGWPVRFTDTVWPPQAVWSAGSVAVGVGFTVTVMVSGVPAHTPNVGVTEMTDTWAVVTTAAVAAMLPEPEAGMPVFTLLLVQVKVAPGVALADRSTSIG